jgi:hypothetical protein
MHGVRVIQKRVAYFDYTVALGDSCAVLSRAELPSVSSLASLVRPHLLPARVGVAGWRRSSGDSTLRRTAHRRSHSLSGVVEDRRPCVGLKL